MAFEPAQPVLNGELVALRVLFHNNGGSRILAERSEVEVILWPLRGRLRERGRERAAKRGSNLQTACRFAVLHNFLELRLDEANLGHNAVDGHELVQVMAAQGSGVQQLGCGVSDNDSMVKRGDARYTHAFPFDPRTQRAACAWLLRQSQQSSNS